MRKSRVDDLEAMDIDHGEVYNTFSILSTNHPVRNITCVQFSFRHF